MEKQQTSSCFELVRSSLPLWIIHTTIASDCEIFSRGQCRSCNVALLSSNRSVVGGSRLASGGAALAQLIRVPLNASDKLHHF
ncbi:hypothetical protein MRX96_033099 [Rhipicephalus microplus]